MTPWLRAGGWGVPSGEGPGESGNAKALRAPEWVLIAGAIALALRQAVPMLLPYLSPSVHSTLREDDYWSFTSGFSRRALMGELLFQASRFLHVNPSAFFSLLLLATYGLVTYSVLRELGTRLRSWPCAVAILLGPAILNFTVDREVLMLVPVLLLWRGTTLSKSVGLFLIPVAALIHELTVILYGPLLIGLLLWECRGRERIAVALTLLMMLMVMGISLSASRTPTFVLEREYWPAFGISGLEASYLYSFARMSLGDVLALHYSVLVGRYGAISLGFAFVLWALLHTIIRDRTWMVFALAATLPVFFTLTIDFGRYAYLVVAFYILAVSVVSGRSDLGPATQSRRFSAVQVVLAICLALWPVGYYAGQVDYPSVIRVAKQVVDRL